MFRESAAARPPRTSRLLLVGGLLVLAGVIAGVAPTPGVSPAHPPAGPLASRPAATTGPTPVTDPFDPPLTDPPVTNAVPAERAAAPPPGARTDPQRLTDRSRSLVFSGALGLLISMVGLTLVTRRRRLW